MENVGNAESNAQDDAQHTNPLAVYTEVSSLQFFHKSHVVISGLLFENECRWCQVEMINVMMCTSRVRVTLGEI